MNASPDTVRPGADPRLGAQAHHARNNDTEDLGKTVAELRGQVSELMSKARDAAANKAGAIGGEIAHGVDQAAHEAMRRGRESREALEAFVRDHPMAAIGAAAGVGLLFGLAMRR